MLIDDLKKKYDPKPIAEVEGACKKHAASSVSNRKDFILGLYYLERTKRYKENGVYAHATFEIYIRSLFNLRYTTYNKERFAYISHPEASAKWGTGLVSKIQQQCGAGKVPDVVKQINLIPNATHDKIERVIVQNSKPKVDISPKVETKKMLEAENIKKGKTIAEYIQTINEKDAQIERMRHTIMKLKAENESLTTELERYKCGVAQVASNPIFFEGARGLVGRQIAA